MGILEIQKINTFGRSHNNLQFLNSTSMKKVRLLHVVFEQPIQRHELPAFRGAIIQKTNGKSILFHNHLGEDQYLNRYPLIQYKYNHGKPGLICIEDGVEEAHHFFTNKDWEVELSGRKMKLTIDQLNLNYHEFKILDHSKTYTIKNWLGLNTDNFKKYKATEDLAEKVQLLKRVLLGNILSMAKGLDWYIEQPIDLQISAINRQYAMPIKGVKVAAFDLRFKCNVHLPDGIGLGKGAGQGFGVMRNIRNQDGTNY